MLALGTHLDDAYPEALREPADPELRELLARFEPAPPAPDDCGARDWSELHQRMHYIVHLFRAFHSRRATSPARRSRRSRWRASPRASFPTASSELAWGWAASPRWRMIGSMGRAAAAAVLILAYLLLQDGAGSARDTATRGKIVFVNVGQGDGVVIKLGSTIVVSDVGEHNAATVDETLRELGAKRIDVAILGHPHDDHVRNLLTLVRDYHWQIGLTVISESQWWQGTKTNRAIIDLLEAGHVPIEVATRSERFHWGGGDWLILNPPKGEFLGGSPQAANVSIAYLLTYNGVRALFTGDIEPQVARRIAGELQPELDEPVDIFLATHHGSAEGSEHTCSTSPPALGGALDRDERLRPPDPDAINRLEDCGASIWCTETNGSITARISAAGRLTWRASLRRHRPGNPHQDQHQNGTCVGR